MPRANMLPNFEIALEEVPCLTNPIGVKGIGESGTIGAPPVVINAIIDALSPLGIDRIDMPATPGKVWEAITRRKARRRRNSLVLCHRLSRPSTPCLLREVKKDGRTQFIRAWMPCLPRAWRGMMEF